MTPSQECQIIGTAASGVAKLCVLNLPLQKVVFCQNNFLLPAHSISSMNVTAVNNTYAYGGAYQYVTLET